MNEEKVVLESPHPMALDLRRIDLAQCYEVRDWCRAFGCTKEELYDAVKAVGTSAHEVRAYLERDRDLGGR